MSGSLTVEDSPTAHRSADGRCGSPRNRSPCSLGGIDRPPPLPYLLAYAHTCASRRADDALRPYGLTVRQAGLLAQLAAEPELTMSELARQLGVTRQSLHGMVGDLEAAGHLCRESGVSARTRRLVLSASARRLLGRVRPVLRRVEVELVADLDPAEVATLHRLLQRILAQATDDEAWLTGHPD